MRALALGCAILTIKLAAAGTTASAQGATSIRLGGATELADIDFSRIVGIRELADGRVLVADALEKKLSVVDFTRRTAVPLGQAGAGPGEYRSLAQLFALPNDTTLVVDNMGGRWLVMIGASFAGVISGDHPLMAAGRNPTGVGRDHVLGSRPARNLEGLSNINTVADSAWLLRFDRRTGAADTLGKIKSRPARIRVTESNGQVGSISVTMNPLAVGDLATSFADGVVAVARLNPYRVDWFARTGTTRGPALPFEGVPISRDEKVAALGRLPQADENRPRDPDSVADWPATMPPFLAGGVIAASDGTVWIRRAPTVKAPGSDYDVIGRDGRLVRRVQLAPSEVVAGFGPAHVYVVVTDDDGLQRLRRYALPR